MNLFLAGLAVLATVALAGCGPQVDVGPVANAKQAAAIRASFGVSAEAGGGENAAASTGTGWATLRGRFIYEADPPTMPPYNVTKDQATCTLNGKPPLQQTLLVDSAMHGIKNIAVYFRNASRVHDSAKPTGGDVVYDQKECVFQTHVCAMTVGQTLDIKNSDNVGHNTNIAGQKNKFNQTIPAGASIPTRCRRRKRRRRRSIAAFTRG